MEQLHDMAHAELLQLRRDLVKQRAGRDVSKHLRDVGRAIRDSRIEGNRIRRKAVPSPELPEVRGEAADERLLTLQGTLLSARIVRALTGNALAAAKQRGASPTEIEALKVANDDADGAVRVARRDVHELKDRKARQDIEVPNHNCPFDSAPCNSPRVGLRGMQQVREAQTPLMRADGVRVVAQGEDQPHAGVARSVERAAPEARCEAHRDGVRRFDRAGVCGVGV